MADHIQELHLDDYRRYGRQMILDGFGLPAQLKLQHSSVGVVGAGGLGCPALQYLAAAGVGRIGIIDHDIVEVSNLQRQILHNEQTVGMNKAMSAALSIKKLNHRTEVVAVTEAISSSNAVSILSSYDVILDCTDNSPTRYLLSDIAVSLGKPLVSGAAQKFDGQLCTYNMGEDGPCYRCLFPQPPAQEMVGTCEETGILGVVTGIIGNMQALEAIKIITGLHDGRPSLVLFSALGIPPFRTVKLRSRKPSCPACGKEGQKIGQIQDTDYVAFCGGERPDWETRGLVEHDGTSRIRAKELKSVLSVQDAVKIIDVRPRTEFGICQLPGTTNVPLSDLVADPASFLPAGDEVKSIYVVCRLGNDSQIAADVLRGVARGIEVRDLVGGLKAWAKDVDPSFPVY